MLMIAQTFSGFYVLYYVLAKTLNVKKYNIK